MRAQHTDGTVITISHKDYYRQGYHRNGWRDVTPPRSDKQAVQSHRFMALGQLARTSANLVACDRLMDPNDVVGRSRLALAITTINHRIAQLKSSKGA